MSIFWIGLIEKNLTFLAKTKQSNFDIASFFFCYDLIKIGLLKLVTLLVLPSALVIRGLFSAIHIGKSGQKIKKILVKNGFLYANAVFAVKIQFSCQYLYTHWDLRTQKLLVEH